MKYRKLFLRSVDNENVGSEGDEFVEWMASPISQIPFPSPLSGVAVDADAEGLVEAVSRKFEYMFQYQCCHANGYVQDA